MEYGKIDVILDLKQVCLNQASWSSRWTDWTIRPESPPLPRWRSWRSTCWAVMKMASFSWWKVSSYLSLSVPVTEVSQDRRPTKPEVSETACFGLGDLPTSKGPLKEIDKLGTPLMYLKGTFHGENHLMTMENTIKTNNDKCRRSGSFSTKTDAVTAIPFFFVYLFIYLFIYTYFKGGLGSG